MKRKNIYRVLLALACFAFGCSGNSTTAPSVTLPEVQFADTAISMNEGQKETKVMVTLSQPIPSETEVQISYLEGWGLIVGPQNDLYISPTPSSNTITNTITFQGPLSALEFLVSANFDTKQEGDESIVFAIVRTTGIKLGANSMLTLTLHDGTLHSGLAAEYTFDGNLDDTSTNGHHGTNHGATLTTGKSGFPNTAYAFDGSTYVTVANNVSINIYTNDNFTVSLWANPSTTQNDLGGIINDLMIKWVGDAQGYGFGLSLYNATAGNPNTLSAARYDGSACGHVSQIISSNISFQYHHLLFRREGGTLYFYIDNILVGSTTDTATCPTTNTSDLYIGCRGNLLRCYTGAIDDIRIYNRSLTTVEMTGLFEMP